MTRTAIEPTDVLPGPARALPRRRRPVHPSRRIHRGGRANIGLWIPTTAIFALLAPFALLALPFLYLAPRDVIPNPARLIAGLGAVLLSMGGTVVEVDASDCHIRLRLF